MKPYVILILVLLILNIIDYDTTVRIIEAGGTELHPIMNYVITTTGALWPIMAIKLIMVTIMWYGFAAATKIQPKYYIMLSVAVGLYTGVVARSVNFCIEQNLI